MKTITAVIILLSAFALLAGCGGDETPISEVIEEGGEVRVVEEIPIGAIEIPETIVQGDVLTIKISGNLPGSCYLFDRTTLTHEGKNVIRLKAYATKPYLGCDENDNSNPPYDDIIYLDRLPLGQYVLRTSNLKDYGISVIPNIAYGPACPVVWLDVQPVSLPSVIPANLETVVSAYVTIDNICVVPYRLTASVGNGKLDLAAQAYDCRIRSTECASIERRELMTTTIHPASAGTYALYINGKAVGGGSEPSSIQAISSNECKITPAQVANFTAPLYSFVDEATNFSLSGVYYHHSSLSPLSVSQVGGSISFLLAERQCPATPSAGEVILNFDLPQTLYIKEAGGYTLFVNGEEKGNLDVFSSCETEDGSFVLASVTSDIFKGEDETFYEDEIINILLIADLDNSCISFEGVSRNFSGTELSLAPAFKFCDTGMCKEGKRRYHLNYAVWYLDTGTYALNISGVGTKSILVLSTPD